jgi:RNA polymerase sigma-70 factor (ECF subfamily)
MIEQHNSGDWQLARRIASGDEDAFAEAYRRYQASLYRFALHMHGSPAAAEDAVQETFLILMNKAAEYDAARASLSAFLHGIARKVLLRNVERGARQQFLREPVGEERSALPEPLIERADPLHYASRAEQIEAVRLAVLSLPVRYREAVVLCDLEEMDYTEAAAATGCAVGTIRSRLHRGRALLAGKLRAPGRRRAASLKTKGCIA